MPTYQIDSKHVSHDILEGEVIAIHFVTGTYYSLRESATFIWEKLAEPVSVDAIATYFEPMTPDQLQQLRAFLDEMAAEALVIRNEGETGQAGGGNKEWGAFTKPLFEKYSDMQDLLLADPIHDVQVQAGWPYMKQDNAT
jgi:hypothetical protein